MSTQTDTRALGILAGSGMLPRLMADTCIEENRPCFVIALEGFGDAGQFQHVPHITLRLGAVGEALRQLRAHRVTELVFAGGLERPQLSSLRPDWTGVKLLARIGSKFQAGDDALLSELVRFFEEEGFRVTGADEVLKNLLAGSGTLGKNQPSVQDIADITLGMTEARVLGARDTGQAVVTENGQVLGLESTDGTNALLVRIKPLRKGGNARSGVLVKMCKPQQDRRVDLPAIGPDTICCAADAGLAGIAIEAGAALILDRAETIARADALGLFVSGVAHG